MTYTFSLYEKAHEMGLGFLLGEYVIASFKISVSLAKQNKL